MLKKVMLGHVKCFTTYFFLKSKINFVTHASVVTHYIEINFAFQIFLVLHESTRVNFLLVFALWALVKQKQQKFCP